MPLCSPFPGYLSVLVMDNARIHHGEGILELAELFRLFISSITLQVELNFHCRNPC